MTGNILAFAFPTEHTCQPVMIAFLRRIWVFVKPYQSRLILGLICGLWCFIWGWMNADKLGIKNIMMIWTLLLILSIVLNVASGGFNYSFGTR